MTTAQQAADAWVAALQSAATQARIRRGVESVSESPTAAAARALPKFLANVTQAVNDGSMAEALNSVSKSEWIKAFIDKGLSRIGPGATAAKSKVVQFLTEFLPHVEAGAAQVRSMPSNTLEDNIARSAAMIRHNAEFRRTRR